MSFARTAAPGQATAQELRSVYRIEQLDVATRVYGVVGDPIGHSLSPVIMNAAFRRENVNAVYLALHAKTLKDLLTCVREIPIYGISVTMPYKESILAHLHNTDSHTTKIGACNTVVRAQDGKLYGFNTDTAGIIRPLERRLSTLEGARILVLGAGGAARAAVFAWPESALLGEKLTGSQFAGLGFIAAGLAPPGNSNFSWPTCACGWSALAGRTKRRASPGRAGPSSRSPPRCIRG